MAHYKEDHNMVLIDIYPNTVNPISAYLLIKRVAVDWKFFENSLNFEELLKGVHFLAYCFNY